MHHRNKASELNTFFDVQLKISLSTITEDIFYRSTLVVTDEQTPDRDATAIISQWLNQTFQNWMYRVYVDGIRYGSF